MGRRVRRMVVVGLSVAMVAGLCAQTAIAAGTTSAATRMRFEKIVTLMTGERVALGTSPSGATTARILSHGSAQAASPTRTLTLNGHVYVIPASAENYLGRYLDPGLFDVTVLATATRAGRTPLRLTYSGSKPSLPGVTITSSGGGTATGYVTQDSAATFGRALTRQAIADSSAGWPSSSALFGSVTAVALDVAPTSATPPRFPQSTLIIDGISRTGGPMPFAFGALFDTENMRKFAGYVYMVKGEARASVPVGTYSAIFDELRFSRDGSVTVRENIVSDFAVTGTQPHMVVDARNATASPTVTTPRPSVPIELDTTLAFTDATRRSGFGWGWTIDPGQGRIYLTPTQPPAVGTLSMDTHWISVDSSTPGGRYSFDATFSEPGIPADQARSLPGVAHSMTEDNTYTSDRLIQTAGVGRFVFIPGESFAFTDYLPVPIPLHRVDYVYAPDGSSIQDLALADYNAYWDPGFVDGAFRDLVAGSASTQTWFRNPYTLAVPAFAPGDPYAACLACTTGTRMLFVFGLNDGDPLHSVEIFGSPSGKPIAHFTVYRDGVQLFSKADQLGARFRIPSGDATYRVVEDLNRRFTFQSLSTFTTTDVTFRSSQGVPAPKSLGCYTGSTCTVMPVLTARLDLHASTHGTVPVGTSVFSVATGHIMHAAQLPISSVSMQVRRSGTSAWRTLPVSPAGSGVFDARFKAGPWLSGRAMDSRVIVTDTEGGILKQTTRHAFVVGP